MKCETLLAFLTHLLELKSKGTKVIPKDDHVKFRYGFQDAETLEIYEVSHYDIRANKNYLTQREDLTVLAEQFGMTVDNLLQVFQDPGKRDRLYRG